jgi:hypothetical protein
LAILKELLMSELGEDIVLPLRGKEVSRAWIDSDFGFDATDQSEFYSVRIGGKFSIRSVHSESTFSRTQLDTIGNVFHIVGLLITEAGVSANGTLHVQFSDDSVLCVHPDPAYEAWEISTPMTRGGLWIVSLPGGRLDMR